MSICKKLSKLVMRCSAGLSQLPAIADKLRELFAHKDIVVFLQGDLAAGKTTLVQHYTNDAAVSSPTFSLQNCYSGDVYHYDLYTIDTQKFMQSGLIHELEKSGVHFIEWAGDDLREFIRDAGFETALIRIESHGDIREYTIDVT